MSNTDSKLIETMHAMSLTNPTYNPEVIEEKTSLIKEIDSQNLSNVSGWGYIENNMPLVKAYIIDKCTEEDLNLYDFLHREGEDTKSITIRFVNPGDPLEDEPLCKDDITKVYWSSHTGHFF